MDRNIAYEKHLESLAGSDNFRVWRDALLLAVQSGSGTSVSDDVAEADSRDALAETSSASDYVNRFFNERGIDVRDPMALARAHSTSNNIGRALLYQSLGLTDTLAFTETYNAWLKAFNENVVRPYMQQHVPVETLAAEIAGRQATKPKINSFFTGGGLTYSGHQDRLIGAIQGAQNEVLTSQFSLTNQDVIGSLLNASERLGGTNVKVHAFSGMDGLIGNVLGHLSGFTMSTGNTTDHFKSTGVDLNSIDVTKRKLILGSANTTNWGLNKNVESTYQLDWEYAQRVGMSRDVFTRLTDQGREALLWSAHQTGNIEDFATFDKSGFSITRSAILTGMGTLDAHRALFREFTAAGAGKISIVSWNIGAEFQSHILTALRAGVEVNVLLGNRPDFNSTGTAGQMKAGFHAGMEQLQAIAAQEGLLHKLNIVLDEQHLVHAKVSVFESASGKSTSIFGSTNLDDKTTAGNIYRNMGMLLTSDDDSSVLGQGKQLRAVMANSAMYNPFRNGFRSLSQEEADSVGALRTKYGLRPWELVLHKRNDGVFAQANVGGTYTVLGSNIHLDNLADLSFFKNDREFGDRLFVPELSKAITPTLGTRFGTREQLKGSTGPRLIQPMEVVAAGISTVNQMIQEELEQRAVALGSVTRLQDMLRNPYERSKLKAQVKVQLRDMFKNYAGIEPGRAAFTAKAHTRLLMPLDGNDRLSTRYDRNMFVDASTMNKIIQGKAYRVDTDGDANTHAVFSDLAALNDFGFSSGQLSRFSKSGDFNPARVYDLALFETMRMTARRQQDDGSYQYFFMLPIGKMSQLPQRLQTNMAARNLVATSVMGKNTMAAQSFLLNQDGSSMDGIRVRGMLVVGMTGDNAYANSDAWAEQFFEDHASRQIKLDMAEIVAPESIAATVRDSLDSLLAMGDDFAVETADGRVLIKRAGLNHIDHKLKVASRFNNGILSPVELDLKSGGKSAHGVVIDVNNMRAQRRGQRTALQIGVSVVTQAASGSRLVLGLKTPLAFLEKVSGIFTEVDRIVTEAGVAGDVRNLFKQTPGAVLAGQGVIKDASMYVETGAEVLRSGLFETYAAGMSGTQTEIQFTAYRDLLTRMRGLFSAEETAFIENLFAEGLADPNALLKELRAGQTEMRALKGIALGTNARHTALSLTAFALHAMYYVEKTSGGFATSTVFNQTQEGPTTLMGMAAIPVWFTSAISASSVAMSERPVVRMLNYHNGPSNRGIYSLMRQSRTNRSKQSAYKELFSSTIMNTMSRGAQTVAGHLEFSAMSYFQEGYAEEFTEIERITRSMQKAKTVAAVQELQTELDAVISKIEAGREGVQERGAQQSGINQFLGVQSKTRQRQTRLLVPVVETLSNGVNIARGAGNFVSAMLLSADTLMAFGSFDDYSHQIQTLQYAIEQDRGVLRKIKRNAEGKYVANFSADEERRYVRLLQNIGQLEIVQSSAPTTDLQKYMGGMLTQPGQNMIANTAEGLPTNVMVVGDDGMAKIQGAIKQQVRASLKQLYGSENMGSFSGAARVRRVFGSALSEDTRNLLMDVDYGDADATDALIDRIAEEVSGNHQLRSRYAPGLFQRAGAPIGPDALQHYRIYSVAEYKALSGNTNTILSGPNSERSVFVNSAAMLFNLGDFDGDTASVGLLEHFIHLRSIVDLMGMDGLTQAQQRLYKRADKELNVSFKARAIRFTNKYTGLNAVFGASAINSQVSKLLGGTVVGDQDDYERDAFKLEQAANEAGIIFGDLTANNFNKVEELAGRLGMNTGVVRSYLKVRDKLFDQALAANKFSHDIHETYFDVLSGMQSSGLDAASFYRRHGKDLATKMMDKSQNTFRQMGGYLKEYDGKFSAEGMLAEGIISDKELMPFFIQTTYASTMVIGKAFEMVYISHLAAGNQLAKARAAEVSGRTLIDKEGKYIRIDDHIDGLSASAFRNIARADAQFEKLAAVDLIIQQMARDAIKPKVEGNAIKDIKDRLARLAGMSRPDMIQAAMMDSIAMAQENEVFQALEALHLITYDSLLDSNSSAARFGGSGASGWGRSSSSIQLRVPALPEMLAAADALPVDLPVMGLPAEPLTGVAPPADAFSQTKRAYAVLGNAIAGMTPGSAEHAQAQQDLLALDNRMMALAGLDENMKLVSIGSEKSMYQYKASTSSDDAKARAYSRAYYEVRTALETYTLSNILKAAETGDISGLVLTSETEQYLKLASLSTGQDRVRNVALYMASAREGIAQQAQAYITHVTSAAKLAQSISPFIQAAREGGMAFQLISGSTSLEHKIIALQHQSERGKFSDPDVLKSMTLDVFEHIDSQGLSGAKLMDYLESKVSNTTFVEMIYDLYKGHSNKQGAARKSVERMIKRTEQILSGDAATAMPNAPAAVTGLSSDPKAEAAQAEEAQKAAVKAEKAAEAARAAKVVADSLYGAEVRLAAMHNIQLEGRNTDGGGVSHSTQSAAMTAKHAVGAAAGHVVSSNAGGNVLQAGAMVAAGAVTGGFAGMGSGAVTDAFFMNLAGAAIGTQPFATAQMLKEQGKGQTKEQQRTTMMAFTGGAIGGAAGAAWAQRSYKGYGPKGMSAASLATGLVGGLIGGGIGSYIANLMNNSGQQLASLDTPDHHGLEEQFQVGYEDIMEGFETVRTDMVQLFDYSGELVAEGFYSVSMASADGLGSEADDFAVAMLDGFMTNHTYEKSTESPETHEQLIERMASTEQMYSDMS